jgi:hypothetical protein
MTFASLYYEKRAETKLQWIGMESMVALAAVCWLWIGQGVQARLQRIEQVFVFLFYKLSFFFCFEK